MALTKPPSNLFVRVTNRIIANLRDDENLSEGLSEDVVVFKGPRSLRSVTNAHAIFVYRSGTNDYAYSLGDDEVGVDAVWTVHLVTRHMGDPDQLDDYVNIFAVNVLRNLMFYKMSDLWRTGTPGPSVCVTVRDADVRDQSWEIELIPFLVEWLEDLHEEEE